MRSFRLGFEVIVSKGIVRRAESIQCIWVSSTYLIRLWMLLKIYRVVKEVILISSLMKVRLIEDAGQASQSLAFLLESFLFWLFLFDRILGLSFREYCSFTAGTFFFHLEHAAVFVRKIFRKWIHLNFSFGSLICFNF